MPATAPALGAMYFGSKVDDATAHRLLDYYVDHGGRHVDTSNNYAFWLPGCTGDESETCLGRWLAGRPDRERLTVATKVGARPTHYTGTLDDVVLEGLGRETILASVERSLRHLRTDYLDVLYAHVDHRDGRERERYEAFAQLAAEGKVRAFGISNTTTGRLADSFAEAHRTAADFPGYRYVQQKYTYLAPRRDADFWVQRLLTEEMIDYAGTRPGLEFIAYTALLSGAYAKTAGELPPEYATHHNRLRWAALDRVARDRGHTRNQVVLAWMMQRPGGITPLISASRVEQLAETMASAEVTLSSEEVAQLSTPPPLPANDRVRGVDVEVLSDNWYTLRKYSFDYRTRDGAWQRQQREAYDRGDGATVLLYDPARGTVVLTRQFRLPTYVNGNPSGLLLETCAGLLDRDDPEDCIRRETEEETGYRVTDVRRVFECYMSPGSVTELLYFFVAKYSRGMRVGDGGGAADEQENIEVVELDFEAAYAKTQTGEIRDAKTIMLLQYAKLHDLLAGETA